MALSISHILFGSHAPFRLLDPFLNTRDQSMDSATLLLYRSFQLAFRNSAVTLDEFVLLLWQIQCASLYRRSMWIVSSLIHNASPDIFQYAQHILSRIHRYAKVSFRRFTVLSSVPTLTAATYRRMDFSTPATSRCEYILNRQYYAPSLLEMD